MMEKARETTARRRILASALHEFRAHGFEAASLRTIADRAGVTTGAIYGYFPSKLDLFDAVVKPAGDTLASLFEHAQEEFCALSAEEQDFPHMLTFAHDVLERLVAILYDNRQVFLVIFKNAAGTPWNNYAQRFVEVEIKGTVQYMESQALQSDASFNKVSEPLMRVLAESYFRDLFTLFCLDSCRESALENMRQLINFYHRGYEALLLGKYDKAVSGTSIQSNQLEVSGNY